MECLLPYLCMVTVPHILVGLERMLDYRGVRLERFHCTILCTCTVDSVDCTELMTEPDTCIVYVCRCT